MKNDIFLIAITNCEQNFGIELIVSVVLNIFIDNLLVKMLPLKRLRNITKLYRTT